MIFTAHITRSTATTLFTSSQAIALAIYSPSDLLPDILPGAFSCAASHAFFTFLFFSFEFFPSGNTLSDDDLRFRPIPLCNNFLILSYLKLCIYSQKTYQLFRFVFLPIQRYRIHITVYLPFQKMI